MVDATRLAGALAGVRERPLAGLDELLDATRAVLCLGSDVPLELVRRELVVGTRLGEVPPRRRWFRSSRTSRGCSGGCG